MIEAFLSHGLFGGATLAQAAAAPAGQASPMNLVVPVIAMLALIYFVILRPQRSEEKERQKKLADLGRGDKVVTIGGIHGSIEAINTVDGTVTLVVGPKTTLTVDKSAVRTIASKGRDKEKAAE